MRKAGDVQNEKVCIGGTCRAYAKCLGNGICVGTSLGGRAIWKGEPYAALLKSKTFENLHFHA